MPSNSFCLLQCNSHSSFAVGAGTSVTSEPPMAASPSSVRCLVLALGLPDSPIAAKSGLAVGVIGCTIVGLVLGTGIVEGGGSEYTGTVEPIPREGGGTTWPRAGGAVMLADSSLHRCPCDSSSNLGVLAWRVEEACSHPTLRYWFCTNPWHCAAANGTFVGELGIQP